MKKTLCALAVICALMILPVTVPVPTISVTQDTGQSLQSELAAPRVSFDLQIVELKLVSEAAAWPPDCDDGFFSARCVRALIMQLFGGRDNW
jgi:hypothetical protein